METNKDLVDYLVQTGVLRSEPIITAFRAIDRADFVQPSYLDQAYGDYPLPIGIGQTISQPTTVGIMLELLAPKHGEGILDVGSGSGWTTALLTSIVGSQGKVIGLEIVPELVEFGRKNLAKYRFPWATILLAGKELGYPKEAPHDRILVSAFATELPRGLVDQLKIGGRMVVPIEGSVWQIDRVSKDKLKTREFPGFAFVPLRES